MNKPKPQWHRLRHRETGEEQTVACLGGIDLDVWEAANLSREPTEDHVYDWDARRLKRCPVRRADREARGKLAQVSKRELVERIEALEALVKTA